MRAEDGFWLRPGMRVGVLGGSFDPPHEGHRHLSLEALKRFDLDRIIWLVSPGNPLKPDAPADAERRVAAAKELTQHPRLWVSDFELRKGCRHTAQTLALMQAHWRGVQFVWLMGADNLTSFHEWKDWQQIMNRVPVGVLARPGSRLQARFSMAAKVYQHSRLSDHASQMLGSSAPPRWCYVNIPLRPESSTAIRATGQW